MHYEPHPIVLVAWTITAAAWVGVAAYAIWITWKSPRR